MLGRKSIRVRCINCSYNNKARSIGLIDKLPFLFVHVLFIQISAFEIGEPYKMLIGPVILIKTRHTEKCVTSLLEIGAISLYDRV